MYIDSHSHGMHADLGPDGLLVPPLRPIWDGSLMSEEEYVKKANEIGLEGVLILDPPHVTFELKRLFGDYVLAAPQVDLEKTSPEEIDELFAKGAVGIKFIGPVKPYCSDEYLPIYERILAHNGLAVFHTGFLALRQFDPGGILARSNYLDITHMRPSTLDRISRAFPKLKILMAHFGNPWWEEAWKMIKSHKNIYADLSGGTAKTRDFEMWRQTFAPNGELDTVAVGKLCYGTDGSSFIDTFDFDLKMMDYHKRLFDHLKVPEDLRTKVYRENMLMLIDPEQKI